MSGAESFRQLKVWQRAMDLAVECDEIVESLPRSHRATLGVQIRRASASVPANIAEGNGRRTRPDYLRHLSIANGSLLELESHLLLAERLRIVDAARLARAADLSGHVGRMLHGLIRSLTRAELPDSRPHPTPGAHPAPTAVSASPAPTLPLPPAP